MKKAEYYINVVLKSEQKEYPKVNGYVEEVEDSNGNKITVGYHKEENLWSATELSTGFRCSKSFYNTRRECVEEVHENIDALIEYCNAVMLCDYGEKYVKPFREFVSKK